MRWAICLTVIEAILSSAVANAAGPLPSSAQFQPIILAQAGSTGGTIGKQDKSASGGEVRVRKQARRAPVARKHPVAKREQQAPRARKRHVSEAGGSLCRKIVGTWLGSELGEATFGQNGGAVFTFILSVNGKWTCANGIVIVTWNNGVVSRIKISHDGNSLTGVNNDGVTYTVTRK